MALMKCPECSKEISDRAEACPSCGFPISIKLTPASHSNRDKAERSSIKGTAGPPTPSGVTIGFVTLGITLFVILFVLSIAPNESTSPAGSANTSQGSYSFETAKELLSTSQPFTPTQFLKMEEAFKSVAIYMPQYREAQKLLDVVMQKEKIYFTELEKQNKRNEEARLKKLEDEAKRKELEALPRLTRAGKRVFAKHPDWNYEDCDMIGRGEIRIGMTSDQVRAAWGKPYDINRTHTPYGTHEQWVMHEMGGSYVYFENDICTAFQN